MAPHALGRALMLLAEGWQPIGCRVPIRIDRALAEAWAPARLRRCRELTRSGRRPPPILATGLRCTPPAGLRRTFYGIFDGNHRCVAARERGRRFVQAELAGRYAVVPERFLLGRGCL